MMGALRKGRYRRARCCLISVLAPRPAANLPACPCLPIAPARGRGRGTRPRADMPIEHSNRPWGIHMYMYACAGKTAYSRVPVYCSIAAERGGQLVPHVMSCFARRPALSFDRGRHESTNFNLMDFLCATGHTHCTSNAKDVSARPRRSKRSVALTRERGSGFD